MCYGGTGGNALNRLGPFIARARTGFRASNQGQINYPDGGSVSAGPAISDGTFDPRRILGMGRRGVTLLGR